MNVDDLNEVKGLVDWLTPARAAYISADETIEIYGDWVALHLD